MYIASICQYLQPTFTGRLLLMRVFFSLKWKLPLDFIVFFAIRFICTHVISYRTPEDYVWPPMGYWSLTDVTMDQMQYQVSGFTGSLAIIMIYWYHESRPRFL